MLTIIFKEGSADLLRTGTDEKVVSSGVLSTVADRQQRAIAAIRFVARCSRASEASRSLADSADRICSRMELPRLFPLPAPLPFVAPDPSFEVPVLQAERYTDLVGPLLETLVHLESLKAMLEGQQTLHAGVAKLDRSFQENTKTLLGNLARTATSFVNIDADLKEATNALKDATSRRAALEVKAKAADANMKSFDTALDAWLEAINNARTKAGVKSGFTILATGITAIFDPASIGSFLVTVYDEFDKVFAQPYPCQNLAKD
ncbi:hypothetical protein LTR17_019738 [Elasticomyces elasticus]|nr:hypothetical protein LTR17_019738 [Elasticomyces elasticus]